MKEYDDAILALRAYIKACEEWEEDERHYDGPGGTLIDAQNRLYGAEMALDILQAGSEYQEIATREAPPPPACNSGERN